MVRTSNIDEDYKGYEKIYLKERGKLKKDVLFTALFLILGVIIGSVFYYAFNIKSNEGINNSIIAIVDKRLYGNLFDYISFSILGNIKIIVVMMVLATTPICIYLIPIILLLKGIMIGLCSSYIYVNFGFNGILINVLFFMPIYLFSAVFLIYIAKNCIHLSNKIKLKLIDDIKHNIIKLMKYYYSNMVRLMIPFLTLSLMESVIGYVLRLLIL